MSWVRMDDAYPEHPKVDRVGPLAAWLNVCAWAYCARNLTDGFVPGERVSRLADVPKPSKLAAALVDANLWEAVEGGYMVHDYLKYNPSREQVMAERARNAERVNRHRNGGGNGITPPGGNGGSNTVSNGVGTDAPYPAPTRTPKRSTANGIRGTTPLSPPKGGTRRNVRQVLTGDERSRLVTAWAEKFGSEAEVKQEIDDALNHTNSLKCKSEKLYVERWLRREIEEFRPQRGSKRRQVDEDSPFESECICDALRERLTRHPTANAYCDVHGDVRQLSA